MNARNINRELPEMQDEAGLYWPEGNMSLHGELYAEYL